MATDVKTPDFDDLLAAFDIPDMTEGKDAFEHGTDQEAPVEGSRGDNLTPDGGALTTPVKPMPQLQRTRDIVPEIRTDASPDRMPSPLEPIFDLPTNQPEATADTFSSQSEQPYHIPTVKPEPRSDVPSVAIKKEPVADSPLDQSHHLPVLKQNQSESLLDELTNQSETGLDSLKSEEKSRSASPQEGVASTKKVPSIPKTKVDMKPESDIEKTSTKSSSIETSSSRIEKLVTSIIRDEEKVKPLPPKSDDELKTYETKVSPPELQHVTNSQTQAKTSGDSKLKSLLNSEEKTLPTVKKIAPKPSNKPEPSAAKAKDHVDAAKTTSTNKPYNTRPRKQNLKFTFEDDCEFEDDFADEPERDKQPAKSVSVGNQNSIAAMQLKELMRQADKDKKESEAASAGQGSIPKVRITTLRTSQGTIMTAQSVPKQSIIPSSTSSGSVVPIVRTLTSAAMGQLHVAQATAAKTSVVSSPATVQSPGQLSNRVVTQVLTPANNASVRTTPSGTTVHTVTNLGIASILNKPNPVSTYNPNLNVPAKYNFSVPKNGHKCMECGDTFLLYTSLLHHMQRRSIMITINCNICMKSMLFQNKCALLSHSRLHMNRGKKMNLASAIVTPLLKELMNLGQPNPSAPPDVHTSIGQTIVSSASTSTVQRAAVQTAVTSSVSSSQTRPSPSLQQLVMGSQPGAMSCTECRIIVNSVSSLEIHFQRNTSDLKSPSLCSLCGVFFPNKCMLWAHQRIHKNLAPYTCPECGKWEKGGRSAFLKHLRTVCHHYARAKGYKCTHCAAVYDHVNLLKAHVQSAHAEQFFKCPICPMAFKAIPNIRVHILNTHGNQVAGYRSIYKCPLCDTVFTQTTLLSSHLDTHINDKSNHIVSHFRCLECHKSFDPRETFLQHMQTGHVVDMSDSIVLCDLCKASFPSLIDMESHKKTAHSAYSNLTAHTCTQCHQKFVSAQLLLDHKCVQQEDNNSVNNDRSGKKHQCSLCSYVAKTESNLVKHMKFHEKQGVFSCLECGRQLSSQELLAEHLQTHTKGTATVHNCSECKTSFVKLNLLQAHMAKEHGMPKKHPCTMCNRTFESVHSMKRHVRINHQGIKRVYRCWHCKEKPMSYSKRIMLEKHIVSFHGIASEDIDFTQMPDPKQPVSPDQEASTGNEKRRRNGGQQGGTAKRPKRAKMGFQCAKCEFTTEVKEEFLQHFPQHRLNHTSMQCMECSTSFRSEEALRNHLFVQHEYRDQDELTSVLSEMVTYAEKANSQQDGGVNGLANPHNECSVCFKRFDSDSALKTHMRTHGMAFIRSKRSSSND
ncbi:ZNF532 [Branchiostoma lanceolatum]|uniref:ZNF532 protein n=1 Tax=Branchiostoma lanceolatum TaxID=7740 RepID=A0A8K0EL45_BRALA|nr:ZNF532 [Branchiostoma lanceolatum]